MILVPAIDIINGQCVRLTKGDYDTKKVYSESPVEVAKTFEGAGLTHLHVVDLDGARAKHIVNTKVLEAIATKTSLTIDFGGGIKSATDLQTAFDCGAAQVTLGSIAVDAPELVLNGCKNLVQTSSYWVQMPKTDALQPMDGSKIQD
jgi:phosphoribosylformimino-5-aminoimidazole carboxamide ribotide isomerase